MFLYADGQLEMAIHNAEAHLTYDGRQCDIGYGVLCDSFIKIYLDGKLDYRSNWVWDTHAPNFDLRYASPIIRNTSQITIELLDKNNKEKNELLEQWIFNPITRIVGVKRLEGQHWSKHGGASNKLFFDAAWTWMPNYEPS